MGKDEAEVEVVEAEVEAVVEAEVEAVVEAEVEAVEEQEEEEQEEEQEAEAIDFSSLRVVDLRAECKKRGIAHAGRKQELIDRLEEECANSTTAYMKKTTATAPHQKEELAT